MKLVPVILSGGAGTRLWPLSRELMPKQLLALTGERTMLQETAARLTGFPGVAGPIVVCNEAHRFVVAEQLREMGLPPTAILLEPEGRNTAPAIALAAHAALTSLGEDALLRAASAADTIGARAILVHAKDDSAKGFYEHFDFGPSPSDPYHLLLIMKDLLKIVGK